MKVNKATQDLLVENLNGWLDSVNEAMNHWVNKIREAETVEEIMRYKKEMLLEYVNSMPIGISMCYFCLLYQPDDCEEVPCRYGVIHGFCNNEGSDYDEIRKLKNKLRRAIKEKYYKGETYGDC